MVRLENGQLGVSAGHMLVKRWRALGGLGLIKPSSSHALPESIGLRNDYSRWRQQRRHRRLHTSPSFTRRTAIVSRRSRSSPTPPRISRSVPSYSRSYTWRRKCPIHLRMLRDLPMPLLWGSLGELCGNCLAAIMLIQAQFRHRDLHIQHGVDGMGRRERIACGRVSSEQSIAQ